MLDVTRNGNKTTSSCYVSNSILNNSGLGEEGGIGDIPPLERVGIQLVRGETSERGVTSERGKVLATSFRFFK